MKIRAARQMRPPSASLEPAHEAAADRSMGIDMVDVVFGEHPADQGIGLAWLGERGFSHHSALIKAP